MDRLKGVKKAEASFKKRQVAVTYDPQVVTVEDLIATVNDLGYRASPVPPASRPKAPRREGR